MKAIMSALGLIMTLSLCTGCSSARNPEAEQAAIAAAEQWLELIDNENYPKSWETAAELFKGAVTQEQWLQAMQSIRSPLGSKIMRNCASVKYMTSMPGAPDGEYVVIQFETSFEKKSSAIETVTPMLDKDGAWRVSGYYIK